MTHALRLLALAAGIIAMTLTASAIARAGDGYRYEVEIVLDLKEAMFVREAGISVRFEEVVEDSRCPADVECVWEGNARILLVFVEGMANGPRHEIELDTAHGLVNEGAIATGLNVRLLALEPLPSLDAAPERYTATLLLFEPEP